MFFDQLDERNTIVQSNHVFEELSKTGLAGLGTSLAGSSRASTFETPSLRLSWLQMRRSKYIF